jgi:REP element-mobilizing transposase RayT
MGSPPHYRTWRRSRGNRLLGSLYPQGYPIHLTLCTLGEGGPFARAAFAQPVFDALSHHPTTLAACLMPDHLHWLLDDAAQAIETTQAFKSYSTRLVRRAGYRDPLWQRSFWDHVVRRRESLEAVIAYILDNPVRDGLVQRREEYPYSVVRSERFGN